MCFDLRPQNPPPEVDSGSVLEGVREWPDGAGEEVVGVLGPATDVRRLLGGGVEGMPIAPCDEGAPTSSSSVPNGFSSASLSVSRITLL